MFRPCYVAVSEMSAVLSGIAVIIAVVYPLTSVDAVVGRGGSSAVGDQAFSGRLGVELWPIYGSSRRRYVRSPFPCATSSSLSGDESGDETHRYAVIIDAGSSGSRIHVYRWTFFDDAESSSADVGDVNLPRLALDARNIDHAFSAKLDPGLSHHSSDLDRVAHDVFLLLKNASEVVPPEKRRSTPVYVMATAGMRLLMEDRMNQVFQYIDSKMRDESFNPFQYRSVHNTRILSGEEEGVFAWIAVNYLLGTLKPNGLADETVGVLEMGGQSTQIAFIPPGNVMASKFPVHIGGIRYPLYVHSYLNYGQSAIDTRVKRTLLRRAGDVPANTSISNPCMLRGQVVPDLDYIFVGDGNATACRLILESLVDKVDPVHCHQKPCAIGPAYQPSIAPNKKFYAIGSFIHAPKAIKAIQPNETFIPEIVFQKASEYCSRNYNDVMNEALQAGETAGLKYIGTTCQRALYYAVLFTNGYKFDSRTDQIKVVLKVANQSLDWTLGAVLYENELEFIHSCRRFVRNDRSRDTKPMSGEVKVATMAGNSSPSTVVVRSASWLVPVTLATAMLVVTSSFRFSIGLDR